MQTSEQINELASALAKAQGEITGALKDSANPFFKSKYADLASCWDACRGPLSKHGLAVFQAAETTNELQGVQRDEVHLALTTTLAHSSGQWMRSTLRVNPKDDTPQAMGSALTYARRYALTAMVGVAQVDDDGNAGSGRSAGVTEIHSPKGDMGKQIPTDQAMATATAMRGILELDIEERMRELKVLDKHDILNKDPDLYVAASDQLSTKERSAWKTYVTAAKKREQAEASTGQAGRKF